MPFYYDKTVEQANVWRKLNFLDVYLQIDTEIVLTSFTLKKMASQGLYMKINFFQLYGLSKNFKIVKYYQCVHFKRSFRYIKQIIHIIIIDIICQYNKVRINAVLLQ